MPLRLLGRQVTGNIEMRYVQGILQPGEKVLVVGRIHWIVYKDAVIAFLLGAVAFWLATRSNANELVILIGGVAGVVLWLVGFSLAIRAWFEQWITEIAVTNLRVIYKHGFIMRQTAEMNMNKIESVVVTQSVPGRILGYGSIHVRGTGEGIEHLHRVRDPIEMRNCITGH